MKIELNLDQESFETLHELVEYKYYNAISTLERHLKTDKYNILSNENGKTINRTAFEKEVCDYARWIPIMDELNKHI